MFYVEVKPAHGKGRGVFATKDFKAGEIVEVCPILYFTKEETESCEDSVLQNYFYSWEGDDDSSLPLGYGLIYNHSYNPNAQYEYDYEGKNIVYKAYKDIKEGEEITVNYNYDPKDKNPLEMEFEIVD